MKSTFFMFLIAISALATSCDNDDDSLRQPTISGTWNLINITGGLAGIDADFEPGVITWTFNAETSMLSVENNHPENETIYDGLETGTYSYSISNTDDEARLIIDDGDFGSYILSKNQLIIDQYYGADGYLFTLER